MHCKTKRCTRNSIPDAFGYCNACFTRIMEIRKVKALESIAESLKNINLDNISTTEFFDKPNFVKNKIKPKKKRIIEDNDFIPTMDISNIKSTNIKIETKTNNKDLQEISQKLQNI